MMNIIIAVYLVASVNVMLVNSKAFPIIQFEIDINAELLDSAVNRNLVKRSLDTLGNGNILKRGLGPGTLDSLGNGNIPKWSKKDTYTRDNKRSLDRIGNGNIMKRAQGPGTLDPLGNGNILKWQKKANSQRFDKRSSDLLKDGNTQKNFFGDIHYPLALIDFSDSLTSHGSRNKLTDSFQLDEAEDQFHIEDYDKKVQKRTWNDMQFFRIVGR